MFLLHIPTFHLEVLRHKLRITKLCGAQLIIKVSGHQHRWLAGSYDLEIGRFRGDYLVDSGLIAQ